MKIVAIALSALGAVALSGCVIDAGRDNWEPGTSLEERTKLAVEACGAGNVAEVDSSGFRCKSAVKP